MRPFPHQSIFFLPLSWLITFACCFPSTRAVNDFYVGGRDGWLRHPEGSYSSWAGRNRFVVNDILHFRYKRGVDSVLLVNRDEYDKCNPPTSSKTPSSPGSTSPTSSPPSSKPGGSPSGSPGSFVPSPSTRTPVGGPSSTPSGKEASPPTSSKTPSSPGSTSPTSGGSPSGSPGSSVPAPSTGFC